MFEDGAVQVTAKASKRNDKITVNGGWYHVIIYGDAGKDEITLNKGNFLYPGNTLNRLKTLVILGRHTLWLLL